MFCLLGLFFHVWIIAFVFSSLIRSPTFFTASSKLIFEAQNISFASGLDHNRMLMLFAYATNWFDLSNNVLLLSIGIFLMTYSSAILKSMGAILSPCFNPISVGKKSVNVFCILTYATESVIVILINRISFIGIPKFSIILVCSTQCCRTSAWSLQIFGWRWCQILIIFLAPVWQ